MLRIALISRWHVHSHKPDERYVKEFLKQPDCSVTCVWDEDPEIAREWAAEYNVPAATSLEDALSRDDVDGILVTSAAKDHKEIFIAAAKHKKHIHMEKPGGIELSDFENLIRIVKQNKTVFHTGYMYRYNPYVIELKQKIKNGELGDIISVEAQMNCSHSDDVRKWLANFPGGMLFFLGCHLIDLIYSIQGKPKKVIPLSCSTGINGINTCDYGMAVLQYENGVSFAKTNDTQLGGFARRYLAVTGTKATVEICPLEMFAEDGSQFAEKTEYKSENWGDRGQKTQSVNFGRYDAMLAGFASYVRGDAENPWTYDYELELYKLVLEACGK
jgi:predicted dehydrogenase